MKTIKLMLVFTVACSILFISVKGDSNYASGKNKKNMTLLERWQSLEKNFNSMTKEGVKKLLPMLTENTGRMNISKKCIRDTLHLISGIRDIKPWAIEFLDSSAKLWDGLLIGSVTAAGSYNQCLDIKVNSTRLSDKGKRLFNGQYCTIDIRPPMPSVIDPFVKLDTVPEELKDFSQRDTIVAVASKSINYFRLFGLKLGICTPSGCSTNDLNEIGSLLEDRIGLSVSATRCEVKTENKYTPLVIAVILCYSFLLFLFIVGTSIGTYVHYTKVALKSQVIRIFLAFSILTNFKKFSNRHTESNSLRCLYGVRFLAMTGVILGHSYVGMINRLAHGGLKFRSFLAGFFFQVMSNATLQVDVYFFLSGLLLCYILLTKVRTQNFKVNIWMYVIHRLWRILPGYFIIIIFTFLIELFGSGPIWHEAAMNYVSHCYDNWWTNLVFINNFYETSRMCCYHMWFTAAEFQLYLFALVILLPMIKCPKLGVFLAFLTIIVCFLYSAINAYVKNHPPIMIINTMNQKALYELATKAYIKPMTHAGPHAIGMLTGYLLVTKPKLKFSALQQVLGWCIAIFFSTSTLYGTYRWNNEVDPTVVETFLYAGSARIVYTLGIAWMVLCCATGQAGPVNFILSWKVFIPLGRITFLAYLVHPLVIAITIGNIKTEIQTDHYIIIWIFFGQLCVSYAFAFVVYMLVELPFANLESIILLKPKNKEGNSKATRENNVIKEFNIENNVSKEFSTENNVSKELSIENNVSKEFSIENNVNEELSIENNVSKELSVGNNVSKEFSVENNAVKDINPEINGNIPTVTYASDAESGKL